MTDQTLSIEDRLANVERRLEASERRQAQAIEAIAEEISRMHDRFNKRQETLARELGEQIAAVASGAIIT